MRHRVVRRGVGDAAQDKNRIGGPRNGGGEPTGSNAPSKPTPRTRCGLAARYEYSGVTK